MPKGAIYVGRPTKWGNPFTPSSYSGDASGCVKAYRDLLAGKLRRLGFMEPTQQEIAQLRGKDLACWCPLDQPCHADVLLELANTR